MIKCIIVGNGSYSVMMKKYINATTDWDVCAFAVDGQYIQKNILEGIEVISFEAMCTKYQPCDVKLIMGIGYTQMAKVRADVYDRCIKWGYTFENYIHPSAIIFKDVKIGFGNNILERVVIEQGCELGNANLFFAGAVLGHESCMGDNNTMSINSSVAGCVSIGNNCFLGVSSATRDHIKIGDRVLVGASAYAFKDIGSDCVVKPAHGEIVENCSEDYL